MVAWATEAEGQLCRRLRRYGWSQQRIADHMGISRTTVRRRLAGA
ncbi:helix-turn-helix domain-containing protein [Cyanobium sp. PCC 7001]